MSFGFTITLTSLLYLSIPDFAFMTVVTVNLNNGTVAVSQVRTQQQENKNDGTVRDSLTHYNPSNDGRERNSIRTNDRSKDGNLRQRYPESRRSYSYSIDRMLIKDHPDSTSVNKISTDGGFLNRPEKKRTNNPSKGGNIRERQNSRSNTNNSSRGGNIRERFPDPRKTHINSTEGRLRECYC
ncbi:hypothetical protein ACFFRR_003597 [Megaselia abdita]